MSPVTRVSDEALARIRALAERRLSDDEVRQTLSIPITTEEREATRALAAWFCRRYPTPADRLAYVRQAYVRWQRSVRRPDTGV